MRIRTLAIGMALLVGSLLSGCPGSEARARSESAEQIAQMIQARVPAGWQWQEHSYAGSTLRLNMLMLNPRDLELIALGRVEQESRLYLFCPRREELNQVSQPDFSTQVSAKGANGDTFPTIVCN